MRATIPLAEQSGGLYEVSNWDAETLETKFVELSSRTSASRVTVMVEDEHSVDTLAVTLAALRGPKCAAADGSDCHVAEILLAPKLSFSGVAEAPPTPPALDDSKLDLGDKGLIGAGKDDAGDDAKLPPGVNMGKAKVEGGLRADIVQRIVRAHLPEVRACDRAARSKDPKLAGRVTLELVIAASGKVSSASVGDSSVSDASLGECLVKAAKKKWRFPKPRDGAEVEISYPFSFAPG
jgi:TonB family protein